MVLTSLDAEEIVLDTSSATRFPVSTLGRALELDDLSWLTGVDMTELDSISFSTAVFRYPPWMQVLPPSWPHAS